jgi:hypothetical protein
MAGVRYDRARGTARLHRLPHWAAPLRADEPVGNG